VTLFNWCLKPNSIIHMIQHESSTLQYQNDLLIHTPLCMCTCPTPGYWSS